MLFQWGGGEGAGGLLLHREFAGLPPQSSGRAGQGGRTSREQEIHMVLKVHLHEIFGKNEFQQTNSPDSRSEDILNIDSNSFL
jgi:hypothetical protein